HHEHAFGQRVFARTSPAQLPDVFMAVRGFRRYRMLMVTLERIGISNPATYAAPARLASRMSPPDPVRGFLAIAQFQRALALVERMRMVGTLDAAKTEALVNSLLAVPLNGAYRGGILRWIAEELRRALPSSESLDAAMRAALAGPDSAAAAPRIEWEGHRYRVDVAAAERQRLERVQEKQGGATLDQALALAAAAERLAAAPLTVGAVQGVTAQLKSAAGDLSAPSSRDRPPDAEGFPPGVVPPPNPRESTIRG